MFFQQFSKGNNSFDPLFASLNTKAFPKWGLLIRKEFALLGESKFFPLRVDPIKREAKTETGTVASPITVPIHLNKLTCVSASA